ncbi:MAG: CaiB/BaiF CoA transferase family protein [Dehalococcoidia bacterium]
MSSSLSGVRVVELSGGPAVSYCTKLLAGMGADVIKVEPPEGDVCRRAGPFPNDTPNPEASGLFLHLNTGKRGVTLNLARPAARDALRRLLAEADVLVEGFRPGDLAALDLGYERLTRDYPGLVLTSITPFGQDGPYAGFEGSEIVAYALGGYMSITGSPEREPLKAYSTQIEFQSGLQAVFGTLTALTARDLDGRGDWVDVSAMEAASFLLGGVAQICGVTGEVQLRNGTRLIGLEPRYFYPSTLRPCRDGYVHAHTNLRHPDMMAVLMEEPRLADSDLLAEAAAHADEIDALMDRWLAQHDRRDVVARAQELRVPFTEVFTPDEVLDDPHHAERGAFVELDHPVAGMLRLPGPAVRFTATPWQLSRAPLLGEHNADVFGRWYSDTERAELGAAGAVQAS